jgi:trans-aconitate methyltransferase
MMRLSHRLAQQLARPHGVVGHWLGRAMDIANRKPTRLALDALNAQPGEAIVDAGCGTGAALAALRDRTPGLSLAGFDPSSAMIMAAQRRLGDWAILEKATTSDQPFASSRFDAVLALNMLYFCDVEGQMLRDLKAMLKPGGRLIAYVTDGASMQDWRLVGAGLHHLWTAASLREALEMAGFAPAGISVHQEVIARRVNGLIVRAAT